VNGSKTTAATCNASQQCTTSMVTCPNGCNAAGTDCAACAAGETTCSGTCRNLATDPGNCSSCGASCPSPPVAGSGSAICVSSTCDVSCNAGYQKCSGNSRYCQTRTWGFEDGATGGFSIRRTDYEMSVTSVSVSTARAHSGGRALALAVAVHGSVRGFEIGNQLCAGGAIAGNGQQVSAWFYLDPAAGSLPVHGESYFGERLYADSSNGGNIPRQPPVRQWFQVSTPISNLGAQLYLIAVEGYFNSDGTSGYDFTGTVYVDDISIQ
jgi:hypothetical protein